MPILFTGKGQIIGHIIHGLPPKLTINYKTGASIPLRTAHTFYFIPLRYVELFIMIAGTVWYYLEKY